jgi:hypothetical protein
MGNNMGEGQTFATSGFLGRRQRGKRKEIYQILMVTNISIFKRIILSS